MLLIKNSYLLLVLAFSFVRATCMLTFGLTQHFLSRDFALSTAPPANDTKKENFLLEIKLYAYLSLFNQSKCPRMPGHRMFMYRSSGGSSSLLVKYLEILYKMCSHFNKKFYCGEYNIVCPIVCLPLLFCLNFFF